METLTHLPNPFEDYLKTFVRTVLFKNPETVFICPFIQVGKVALITFKGEDCPHPIHLAHLHQFTPFISNINHHQPSILLISITGLSHYGYPQYPHISLNGGNGILYRRFRYDIHNRLSHHIPHCRKPPTVHHQGSFFDHVPLQ